MEGAEQPGLEAPVQLEGEVAVVARFRPLNEEEQTSMLAEQDWPPFTLIDGKLVEDLKRGVCYTRFDRILESHVGQAETYQATAQPLVQRVLAGFNAGMFAYGQSGGGKTYSMFGKEGDLVGEYRGIIPRAISELFDTQRTSADQSVLSMAFFEVYKGELYDLLSHDVHGNCHKLSGREDRHLSLLSEVVVQTPEHAQQDQVIHLGQSKRRHAWMPLNPVSSRSHAVMIFKVKRRFADTSTSESAMFFVDLMGSEALVYGADTDETTAVNMDLLTLGMVIKALSDRKGKLVPPYRGSRPG